MFTKEELQGLFTFLNRVEIKGAEAESLVVLKQKVVKLLQPQDKGDKDESKETS